MKLPTLDLMITGKCPLDCKYCFLRNWNQEKRNTDVSDELIKKMQNNEYNQEFFTFGGEPLAQINKIEKIINEIEKSDKITNHKKNQMIQSIKSVITNNVLSGNVINKIKDLGLSLQVSLDGPKEIHDQNRIFHNGKGSFDIIMKNLEILKKEDIPQSQHGVVQKNTIEKISEIQQFLGNVNYYLKEQHFFSGNIFMIIFEEDYTDENIDTQIEEWIKTAFYFKEEYGIEAMHQMLDKSGGDCGAGKGLFAVSPRGELYPCHRYPGNERIKEEGEFGKLDDEYKDVSIKHKKMLNMYNYFQSNQHTIMVSKRKENGYAYVCPATSMETTKQPGGINNKYSMLTYEMDEIQKIIYEKYPVKKNVQEDLFLNVGV